MIPRGAVAVLVLLAGCATGPTLDERLAPLIGLRQGDLVARLGVPVRTYEADGRLFLQFEDRHLQLLPTGGGYYGGRYGGWWGPNYNYVTLYCGITFAIRDDRVESFSYRGQGCR